MGIVRVTVVQDVSGVVMCDHPVLFTPPKNLTLVNANVSFTVSLPADGHANPTISVETDHAALFVTLTTLAQGRFSDNAFLLLPGSPRQFQFVPFPGFDHAVLTKTLRVEHVATYR